MELAAASQSRLFSADGRVLIATTVQRPWFGWCVLAAASGLLFFYGIGVGDLWRTESLRAIIAQEMLQSGDWLVPRLYGEPIFTKPPGMYLAIALCSWPWGEVTAWTARLPSALAASGCVFLFAWFFGRRFGQGAGLAAGLILPMSMMWLDKASVAEIDMLQTAWVTAAILFFLRAVEEPVVSNQWSVNSNLCSPITGHGSLIPDHCSLSSAHWWLAALLCVAGGVLTKWTAPEFFYGTAIPYLWWTGRLRLLFRWPHLLSASLAALVCLAWIVAAALRSSWNDLYSTVVWEGLSRLLPGYNGYRPYSWGETLFHPIKLLINTLPWSALALLALRPSFFRVWNERDRGLLIALHCWVWPQMLFWSLLTEHTPRHSFPLFPGLAGLAVMVWHAWQKGKLSWSMPRVDPVRLLIASLALWFAVKVVYVETILPTRSWARQPRNKGAVLDALVPDGQTLYLLLLKDEGIMFYYGRTVVRLHSPEELPQSGAPVYCILTQEEWRGWNNPRHAELVQRLDDEQGAPIYLVRVF